MDDIITQLQGNALDSTQSINDLLRRAYLVAKKLNLTDFETWISSELNGYDNTDNIPDYRNIKGKLKFFNPYQGWCPVIFENFELEQAITVVPLRNSIPSIVDLIAGKNDPHLPISPEMIATIANDSYQAEFEHAIFLDKTSMHNIVELIRTKILEWAILLEEKGIQGNGLSFTSDEVSAAKDPVIIQYINHFYAPVSDTQIQQGTENSEQSN